MGDLQLVALDIKNTLAAAMSDLKTEFRAVATRMEHMENVAMTHGAAIEQIQQTSTVHTQHLMDMHRHMKDLDNRGRRCKLRIRGIPESVEGH